MRSARKIHKLLTAIENRFESESGKASVRDYIRLLQLERELDEQETSREVRVTCGSSWLGNEVQRRS